MAATGPACFARGGVLAAKARRGKRGLPHGQNRTEALNRGSIAAEQSAKRLFGFGLEPVLCRLGRRGSGRLPIARW